MDYDCNCITRVIPENGRTQHIFCEMHQTAESLLKGTAAGIKAQTGIKPALNEIIPTMQAADISIPVISKP